MVRCDRCFAGLAICKAESVDRLTNEPTLTQLDRLCLLVDLDRPTEEPRGRLKLIALETFGETALKPLHLLLPVAYYPQVIHIQCDNHKPSGIDQ